MNEIKKYILDDKLHEIAALVLTQAVKDYTAAVRKGDRRTFGECRMFFRSGWCDTLIDAAIINVSTGRELLTKLDAEIGFDREEFEKCCEERDRKVLEKRKRKNKYAEGYRAAHKKS